MVVNKLREQCPQVTHATGVTPRHPTLTAIITGPPDQHVSQVPSEPPTESTPQYGYYAAQAAPSNQPLSQFWKAVGRRTPVASTSVCGLHGKSGVPTSVWTHLQFV